MLSLVFQLRIRILRHIINILSIRRRLRIRSVKVLIQLRWSLRVENLEVVIENKDVIGRIRADIAVEFGSKTFSELACHHVLTALAGLFSGSCSAEGREMSFGGCLAAFVSTSPGDAHEGFEFVDE